MKYFGIFDPKILELSDIEIENLMLEKELLVKNLVGAAINIENNVLKMTVPETVHISPSKELIDEYYKFIIDLYQSEVLEIKLPFFKIFNDEIYGLELKEQKEKALKYYKEIFNTIYKDVITIYDKKVSDDGIIHTHTFNKLKMLYYQLEANKSNLSDTRTSLYYLIGDRKSYIDGNFVENELVSEVLKFEAWKQIVVELNSRFGFEDDYYFTSKFQNDVNFLKYKKIFKRLESYQFTNTKIKNFVDDEKAKSVSLYQALIDLDLITDNKEEFKRFMKTEYDFSPSEIVTYEKKINRTHDKRVTQFKDDWQKFDVQK
jgi:AraC-like DNA-binding protein